MAFLQSFAAGRGYVIGETLTDIGSALNYRRENLLRLLSMIVASEVDKVIVAHKDRLVRLGFEFLEELFAKFSAEIVVVNRDERAEPAQETAEDMTATVQHFAARRYGKRSYRRKSLVDAIKREVQGHEEAQADDTDDEPPPQPGEMGETS